MACSSDTAGKSIKLMAVVCAIALILLGVLKFVYTANIPILTGIWTVYWIIFGTMLLLVEMGIRFVKDQIGFMDAYCGKGMFIIFCGTLLIDDFSDANTVWESIVGLVIIFLGASIIVVGYTALPSQKFPPQV